MRDKENQLTDLTEKKQALVDRIDHLKKSNPKSKKLVDLERELVEITKSHDKEHETAIDYKRFILKEAFYLRFNALSEYAEKSALIANFGKYLIDLIDIESEGEHKSDMVLMDALLTIDGWEPLDQRHTLTKKDDLLSFEEGEDATLLTDQDLVNNSIKRKKEEEQESCFNEKANNNYYYQLYNHIQQQPKKEFSSHRSYAEFQNQFNNGQASTKEQDSPPAYTTNENNIETVEKSKK